MPDLLDLADLGEEAVPTDVEAPAVAFDGPADAADDRVGFENRRRLASLGELPRGGEPGRPGADDDDALGLGVRLGVGVGHRGRVSCSSSCVRGRGQRPDDWAAVGAKATVARRGGHEHPGRGAERRACGGPRGDRSRAVAHPRMGARRACRARLHRAPLLDAVAPLARRSPLGQHRPAPHRRHPRGASPRRAPASLLLRPPLVDVSVRRDRRRCPRAVGRLRRCRVAADVVRRPPGRRQTGRVARGRRARAQPMGAALRDRGPHVLVGGPPRSRRLSPRRRRTRTKKCVVAHRHRARHRRARC